MRSEVLRKAIMINNEKIENLFRRVSRLETTLNEINDKLSQLANNSAKSKVFYESKVTTNYYCNGNCYIRMPEEDFEKFKNGERINFELYQNITNKFVASITKCKIINTVDGNAIEIGDHRFVISDFVPIVINNNGTEEITSSSFVKNSNKKIQEKDFKPLYEKLGFDKWYEEVILPHKMVMEIYGDTDEERIKHDNWEENISLKDKYARIADMLSWFDIDKIARNIARVNLASDNDQDKIVTFRIDNEDVSSIRNGLYEDVKECVEGYFKYGEANDEITYKEYQYGRVHLLTIRCHDKNDGDCDKVRLFWTNEDVEDVYDIKTV